MKEKRDMAEKGNSPSLQEVNKEIVSSGAYVEIFPEIFNF